MDRFSVGSPARRLLVAATAGLVATTTLIGVDAPADAARTDLSRCVNPDNGLPVVEEIAFSPATVDVSESARRVTLTMTARDTGGPGPATGVRYLNVKVTSPDGFEIPVELRRDAGHTWVGRFRMPLHAPAGEWTLEQPVVQDRARNQHGEEHLADLMTRAPWDVTLPVSSGRVDTVAPTATDLSVSPHKVNTRQRSRQVRFTVDVSDKGSGVGAVRLYLAGGGMSPSVELRRRDSVWRGTLTVPRWVGVRPRTWRIRTLHVEDRLGNGRSYRGTDLEAVGETAFRVRSGKNDTEPPRLRWARIRPRKIDVRTEAKTVRVTVRVRDRRSGVSTVEAGIPAKGVKLHRASGTARRGTWTGRLRLRPCTQNIHSSLVRVQAFDRRYNQMFELPQRLRIRARDNTAPRASAESNRIGTTGPLTLVFNEPVTGISSRSVTVRSHPYPRIGPEEVGTWSCLTGDGSSTSCLSGRVRTARWMPEAPLPPDTVYLIELNPEGILDVMDLAGNAFRRLTMNVDSRE